MTEIAEQAGSPEIVYELLGLFFVDVEARLQDLSAAVASANDEQRERVAHSIKGSCANLGAELMAGLARAIEHCETDAAHEILKAVELEFEELKSSLRQHYPCASLWNSG